MKKRIIIGLVLIAASIPYFLIKASQLSHSPHKTVQLQFQQWKAPRKSLDGLEFNEVRAVCIPRNSATGGAAVTMKRDGAHITYTATKNGQPYFCYAKFFYNPLKRPYARMICGGRRRYTSEESLWAYNSLQQLPCLIQPIDPVGAEQIDQNFSSFLATILDLKHNGAANKFVEFIQEASNYLKYGQTSIDPNAPIIPTD